jgi:hypothetical protein
MACNSSVSPASQNKVQTRQHSPAYLLTLLHPHPPHPSTYSTTSPTGGAGWPPGAPQPGSACRPQGPLWRRRAACVGPGLQGPAAGPSRRHQQQCQQQRGGEWCCHAWRSAWGTCGSAGCGGGGAGPGAHGAAGAGGPRWVGGWVWRAGSRAGKRGTPGVFDPAPVCCMCGRYGRQVSPI